MGLASIFMCSEFNLWYVLGCKTIILDCSAPKLPEMGICELNMCVAKHPKVHQIYLAPKSFENFSNLKYTNFCSTFPLIIYYSKCLQSTEVKLQKLNEWWAKLFVL